MTLRVIDRMADSKAIRSIDNALFGKKEKKSMARIRGGSFMGLEFGEDGTQDQLTAGDLIEFGAQLKKARVDWDTPVELEAEYDRPSKTYQYKLTVKG